VLEHRLDVAIRAGADGDRAATGGFDALGSVLFREAEQAQTRAIALLRARPTGENLLDERGGVRTDGRPPPNQA
jgi:hypothetical protein